MPTTHQNMLAKSQDAREIQSSTTDTMILRQGEYISVRKGSPTLLCANRVYSVLCPFIQVSRGLTLALILVRLGLGSPIILRRAGRTKRLKVTRAEAGLPLKDHKVKSVHINKPMVSCTGSRQKFGGKKKEEERIEIQEKLYFTSFLKDG